MSVPLGQDAKLYRLSTGTRASWGTADSDGFISGAAPSNLTEVSNVKDLSMPMTHSETDLTTRGNNGWDAIEPVRKSGEISFQMMYDTADAQFVAFWAAWIGKDVVAVAALDGDKATTGTRGFWADCKVLTFGKGEQLSEGQMVDVVLKPCYSSVAPQIVKVTA